jgi:hypothetical protein
MMHIRSIILMIALSVNVLATPGIFNKFLKPSLTPSSAEECDDKTYVADNKTLTGCYAEKSLHAVMVKEKCYKTVDVNVKAKLKATVTDTLAVTCYFVPPKPVAGDEE